MTKFEDELAQAQKKESEVRALLLTAELEKTQKESLVLDSKIESESLYLAQTRRRCARDEAHPDESNVYTFYGSVGQSSVQSCMHKLSHMSNQNPGEPITLILNSPGGSVIDGLALYDYLRELSSLGHHITVHALGMAASMGGILLQAGDTRSMGKNAFVLIHEVSSIGLGSLTEIEDELKFLKQLQGRCIDILSEKSDLTPRKIKSKWERKDWWISSEECRQLNIVDQVV